jgi:GNAT superfamily N-acetyltransferase
MHQTAEDRDKEAEEMPSTGMPDQPAIDASGQHTAVPVPEETARLEGCLALRNGKTIHVRPIRADDTEGLCAFHTRLSTDTVVFRYFRSVPILQEDQAEHLTHVDYESRMALVATTGAGDDEQIIAVVRYERVAPQTAEVAFVVEDRWQGLGIGTALFLRLAQYARGRGFTTFIAEVMASNMHMRNLFSHSGFPSTATYADGCVEVRLDISQPVRAL